MPTPLRYWIRNATDRLDSMWTEPLSWLVLLAAAGWIVYEYRRAGKLDLRKSFAIGALGVWLVAAFSITIYPIRGELTSPSLGRFEVESIVPLWGLGEAFANADGFLMTDEEWQSKREELAAGRGVPVDQINLDRRVHGPGVSGVLKDPLGNTILFMPLGFLAALGWPAMRSYKRVLLAGAAVSAGIELSQFLFGLGSLGTIDDVIFNSAGGAVGYAVYLIWGDIRSGLMDRVFSS
jgi:hypothetical protein